MRMPKLPHGFKSYIQLYDYLQQNVPQVFDKKTIVFLTRDKDFNTSEFKITVNLLKAKCFDELQEYRCDAPTTNRMVSAMRYGVGDSHVNEYRNASSLLFKLVRHGN